MEFRKTRPADVERVMELIDGAKLYFRQHNVPQWQDGYPNEVTVRADMAAGNSYVLLTDSGRVAGTMALVPGPEPSYQKIFGGAWLTQGPYAVLHRLAVDGKLKQRGYASALLREAERIAAQAGAVSVRVDTHEINMPMQRLMRKNEYQFCGTIHLADGAPRFAFEKVLQNKTV